MHSAYSWDRGPSIVVSGQIGFSVSSTDQESKHILFHLTVDCKVISRSNITSRRLYFHWKAVVLVPEMCCNEAFLVMEP